MHDAIAIAAKSLNDQRERWLNPPEWIAEVAAEVDAVDNFADVAKVSGPEAQRLIRQSAIDAAAAQHPKLKKRTLTNLYNERPTWLRLAHLALDRAVLDAYAATDPKGVGAARGPRSLNRPGRANHFLRDMRSRPNAPRPSRRFSRRCSG